MSRRKKTCAIVIGALLLLLGILSGLRVWNRWRPDAGQRSTPVVVLSVGADLVNDAGLHQAPYQAVFAGQGARVLEVTPRDGRSASEILEGADALVLTGGGDVDPAFYGGEPGRGCLVDAERDRFEIALIHEALRRDMPVLAVCRGIHVLNVSMGGSLRDIRQDPLYLAHGITLRSLEAHGIDYLPGSHVRAVARTPRAIVNSFHGQIVDGVGPGLRTAAVASDGVVEALEVPGARFAVAVQWHPELLAFFNDAAARRLFERLLEEARGYRSERTSRDSRRTA